MSCAADDFSALEAVKFDFETFRHGRDKIIKNKKLLHISNANIKKYFFGKERINVISAYNSRFVEPYILDNEDRICSQLPKGKFWDVPSLYTMRRPSLGRCVPLPSMGRGADVMVGYVMSGL